MKGQSEELLELIRGLTAAEKRYFRRYGAGVGGEGERQYLRLYEFLANHQDPTDAAIRAHFEGEAFLRQLPVAKHYLLNLILDALRAYDQGKTPSLELTDRLDKIELLYRRRMFKGAAHQVLLARKLALALEQPAKMLELLRWDLRLVRHAAGKEMATRLQALHTEETHILQALQAEADMMRAYDQAYTLLASAGSTPRETIQSECTRLLALPVMQQDPGSMGFETRIMYHYIQAWLSYLQGDIRAYIAAHKVMLGVWEATPARLRLETERYFRTLLAYVDSTIEAALLPEVPPTLAKLRRLLQRSKELTRSDGHRVFHAELRYYLNTAQFETAAHTAPDLIESLRAAQTLSGNMRIAIHANLSVLWFCLERWTDTYQWLEKLLRIPETSPRIELTLMARIMRIVCSWERQEFDRAEQQARALRKTISKEGPKIARLLTLADTLFQMASAQIDDAQAYPIIATELNQDGLSSLPFAREISTWATARHTSGNLKQAFIKMATRQDP